MRFSIIIPVYDVAEYLRECLDSLVRQGCRDWEAICIDDGSTDGSGEILDEYAAKDGRFQVVHQPNRGVSAARNVGLDRARGEWIWFVDGDDAIHPDALCFLSSVFDKYPRVPSICIGDLVGVHKPDPWPVLDDKDAVISSLRDTRSFRRFRRAGWAVVYRRAQIGTLRFKPFRIGEDVLFCQEHYWASNCWAETANPLYFYRTRDSSAVNSRPTLDSVRDYLDTCSLFLKLFSENREKWRTEDMREQLDGKAEAVYYTWKRMLFSLTDEEMQALLPRWISLQWQMNGLYPMRLRRRLKVLLISMTKSVRMTRRLVDGRCDN